MSIEDKKPLFFDSETCGFHGPIVLLQFAYGDGKIQLHCPWTSPIRETIELIDDIVNHPGGVVGFNLAFDWFHLCQMYTTLILMKDYDAYLEDCIEEYALNEPAARFGKCLKPYQACDLMLHARKTEYQSTMDRKKITIKRVPTILAWELAEELNKRIKLKDIYFARQQDRRKRWQVADIKDEDGEMITDFKNIVLRFAPSSALKALTQDIFNIDTEDIKLFADIEPPKKAKPEELGYAPFALAIGSPKDWKGAWPDIGKIDTHIRHWSYNRLAQEYASDDVKYTRMLYKHFRPEMNDVDSILACMVGAVRWRGYKIDISALEKLKEKKQSIIDKMEINFDSPKQCRLYLTEMMDETEKVVMQVDGKITTKAVILQQVSKWHEEKVCGKCLGEGCHSCEDGIIKSSLRHPAAVRAKKIIDARQASKAIQNINKLLVAGRFHASFKIIGTKSSRMSGADDLNAQGLEASIEFRECFPLADRPKYVLNGGDFSGFEIYLADAAYGDPVLHKDLVTGKKIHGLFGVFLFPGKDYEEICATKGLVGEKDLYKRSKNGVYAMLYGGEEFTLQNRVGISSEAAEQAYQMWIGKYIVWGKARRKIFDSFCSMRQPGGIGTKVEWHEPADYIESLYGFKRYFTLENSICKVLFNLAEKIPEAWKDLKIKVVRRDRKQTASGAIQSALFAAAFAIQAANMRAAANHVIQSSGATITKKLQVKVWEIQPFGINDWIIIPMNIHDEIQAPALPEVSEQIEDVVKCFIEKEKLKVPLLEIDWSSNLKNWAEK